jgi:hypothetical protein
LRIFNATKTAGNLWTMFAAETITSVTDGAIIVMDAPACLFIGVLRVGESGEKTQG